jgi:predicted short-subunit dehydrogenase-like oxidoreductase (DUF2520 family)
VLGRKLKLAGHSILQVYGRNEGAAAALAAQLSATACSAWKAITQEAALYIVSVADRALESVAAHLLLKDQLVVHTAGAVSMEVFKNVAATYGVFYPFQTIRKEIEPMPELPVMIDANTAIARETLLQVAGSISGKVTMANDAVRMQYHLCAVMTNNFSNYLNVLAEDYCRKHGLDFSNLLPLFDETARRLHHFSPRQVQTGPAIRKDTATIRQHLGLLKENPALLSLYHMFSDEIERYPWKSFPQGG